MGIPHIILRTHQQFAQIFTRIAMRWLCAWHSYFVYVYKYLCKEQSFLTHPIHRGEHFENKFVEKSSFLKSIFSLKLLIIFFWLPKRYAFSVVASIWKIVKWLWKKLEVEVKNFRIYEGTTFIWEPKKMT